MLNGKKVLVVDDEEAILEIFTDELTLQGALVHKAPNGVEAFKLIQSQPFDCVITDAKMPGGDGLTLIRNVAAMPAPRPKLFLSSGFNDLKPAEAEALGVRAIFPKPFNMDQMIKTVIDVVSEPEKKPA